VTARFSKTLFDDHSPPSSDEVKNAWSYTCTPQYASMAWCSVKKAKGQLYLHLLQYSVLTHAVTSFSIALTFSALSRTRRLNSGYACYHSVTNPRKLE